MPNLRITSLNKFDKGFFGSTLMGAKRPLPKNFKPSKLEFDSADDLNRYFHEQIIKVAKKEQKRTVQPSKTREIEEAAEHELFTLF